MKEQSEIQSALHPLEAIVSTRTHDASTNEPDEARGRPVRLPAKSPMVYVWAEDPALQRQHDEEMARYQEEPEGTYCPTCMDLDCTKNPPRKRGSRVLGAVSLWERNVLEFRETGEGGCYICAMLYKLSETLIEPTSSNANKVEEMLFRLELGADGKIVVQVTRSREMSTLASELPLQYQLYTSADSIGGSKPLTKFLNGRDIAADAGSDACFEFAKSCLDDCAENHDLCREFLPSSRLPTRVVFLGANNSEIKLVEPPSDSIAPFAALSYCWGKTLPITTKRDTIDQRKLGMSWDTLPSVFQDALVVTRKMGLAYLWIDSLCIIQDSAEDWQIESSRMAEIYQGATITIAVGSSDSCTKPFLTPRRRGGPAYPITLKVDGSDGSSYCLKARELAPPHNNRDEILNTRAWTYQERVLSSRILHYTADELVWECRKGTRCECQAHDSVLTALGDEGLVNERPEDPRTGNPFNAWQAAISDYSGRNLTYFSDKLPALSGVAKVVSQRTKSSYLAGLWHDNLLCDLQWAVHDLDFSKKRPPESYGAPTFSWASLQMRSGYMSGHGFTYDATVLETNSTPNGLNLLGAVKDGFIKLEGLVLPLMLSCPNPEAPEECSIDFPKPPGYRWDDLQIKLDTPLGEESRNGSPTARRLLQGEDFKPFQAPASAILLGRSARNIPVALILGGSKRVNGAYERLGIAYLTYYQVSFDFIKSHHRVKRKTIIIV